MSLIRGNALSIPLADESVDLIVTSPPYFALRSYTDGGEHYDGQLGSEATPAEFVAALLAVTAECVRVLKPSGSLFVNLGDKYNSATSGQNGTGETGLTGGEHDRMAGRGSTVRTMRPKSLMGLPWRYALGCIDDLGLILRAEVIWSKPNGLPESVTDRVRRSHEQWFHFTREPRYFSAVDEVREPHAPWTLKAYAYEQANDYNRKVNGDRVDEGNAKDYAVANPLGKLPGSVRTVATEPLKVPDHLPQHFAAFPSEWPRWIITGWSPSGICVECGEGRRPTVDKRYLSVGDTFTGGTATEGRHRTGQRMGDGIEATITGESCDCWTTETVVTPKHPHMDPNDDGLTDTTTRLIPPKVIPPTTPARVLDPFCGTGTTVAVANALGRHGIGLDLSADYLRLARWRCSDPALRAKVLGVATRPRGRRSAHFA